MNLSNTRTTVTKALVTCAPLVALVASDPDEPSAPAIFLDKRQAPPVYPCVTYRFGDGMPDPRFRPTAAEGGGTAPISVERIELRVYSKGAVDTRDQIRDALVTLLDGRILTGVSCRAFHSELLLELRDEWDPALKVNFHLLRFRLRVQA